MKRRFELMTAHDIYDHHLRLGSYVRVSHGRRPLRCYSRIPKREQDIDCPRYDDLCFALAQTLIPSPVIQSLLAGACEAPDESVLHGGAVSGLRVQAG